MTLMTSGVYLARDRLTSSDAVTFRDRPAAADERTTTLRRLAQSLQSQIAALVSLAFPCAFPVAVVLQSFGARVHGPTLRSFCSRSGAVGPEERPLNGASRGVGS